MPPDERLGQPLKAPLAGRTHRDAQTETVTSVQAQITEEAALLKEFIAELRTLNENLAQFEHFKNLGDQLSRLPSLQRLQQQPVQEDGVSRHEVETIEAGESSPAAQEHIRPQPLYVPGSDPDEAEASEADESSLPAQQPLQQEILQEHGFSQDDPQASESGESSPGGSVYSRSGPGLKMLYLYPSEEFLLFIRQIIEGAVDPCACPRLSGRDAVDEAKAIKMMHGLSAPFRDVPLIVPVSSAPDSPSNEIRLHSASLTRTPREFQACKEFIRTSWPLSSVNVDDPFRRGEKWAPKTPGKQGDFWFITGANHDRAFAFIDMQGHPDIRQRPGTEDVQIGQVWMLNWHTSVLNLESAAYILSLGIRQAVWHYPHSSDADGLYFYFQFFAAFLGSWNKARGWALSVLSSRTLLSTDTLNVKTYGFAMRWLCPSNDLSWGPGFPLQRESGRLSKTGERSPSLVREGRALLLFISSLGVPPVFSMAVLSNCGPRSDGAYNVFDETKPRNEIRLLGECTMSIMQLVLMNLLEAAWYQGWVGLLDEIDDSVKVVQVADILDASSTEELLFDASLSQSKTYFQVLQLLRMMPLWIRETRYDLERFKSAALAELPKHYPQARDVLRQNWDKVLEHFTVLEQELLRRIDAKTDEIRGLRDGLISASSLLEASKSTSMNRYIIIFTVLTVLYLPLGFVTAVFSMDLLHEEELTGMKSQYAATMVAVSVVTYTVAIGLVLFVDRQKFKPLLTRLPVYLPPSAGMLWRLWEKGTRHFGPTAETGDDAKSGPWMAPWPSSGLHHRQRRKKEKGKAAEAPEP